MRDHVTLKDFFSHYHFIIVSGDRKLLVKIQCTMSRVSPISQNLLCMITQEKYSASFIRHTHGDAARRPHYKILVILIILILIYRSQVSLTAWSARGPFTRTSRNATSQYWWYPCNFEIPQAGNAATRTNNPFRFFIVNFDRITQYAAFALYRRIDLQFMILRIEICSGALRQVWIIQDTRVQNPSLKSKSLGN